MTTARVRLAKVHPLCFSTLLLGSIFACEGCGNDRKPESGSEPVKVTAPLEAACADGNDDDSDGAIDCSDSDCLSPGGECVAAPALDRTVATSVAESAAYLYTGPNPLQKSVDPKAFEAHRMALLRGRTLDAQGKPLAGVKISIKNHPEHGYTYSRGDGIFDFAVNGGSRLVVDYELAGRLPVQRAVQPGWQRYETLLDVGLVESATNESMLEANAPVPQVIVGDHTADANGERTPIVVLEPNTTARAVLADAQTQALSHLTVTTTAYPITDERTFSPGSVSTSGGLVYGLNFAVKEADELTAEHVVFSKSVSFYVEALGATPVGKELTVQHYDRRTGQWEPGLHGRVIQVLGAEGEQATIDSDGDGAKDADAVLEAQGIGQSDREELAKRAKAGQRLWHAEISHFSSLKFEAMGTPPAGVEAPVARGIVTKPLDNPTYDAGMVIERQAALYREPIAGTPYSLRYQSDRMVSYGAGRMLEVPLVGATVAAGLKEIRCRVSVANRIYEHRFAPAPNLRYKVEWDGNDAQMRPVQGQQVARIAIAYVYPDQSNSGGDAVLPLSFDVPLGLWDAAAFGLGGMSIDVHHAYDPYQQILYYGHGAQRSGTNVSLAVKPANLDDNFSLGTPDSLLVTANGTLIVTDDQQDSENWGRILKIDASGKPSVWFGEGAIGAAAQVLMSQPQALVHTSDGRLIVTDYAEDRLVELSSNGTLRTLISGDPAYSPVVDFELVDPDGIALGPRDELYFVDGTRILRYEAGRVEVYAGGGTDPKDEISAATALLAKPSGLAMDKLGNLFVSEREGHRVRLITPNGVITTVAGTGVAGYNGEGGQAKESQLNDPHGLALDPEGQLYIVDQNNARIRRIAPDGTIQTVVGGGTEMLKDAAVAVDIKLDTPDGIAAGPDGMLYIATKNKVYKTFIGMPNIDQNEHLVPSADGRTLYRFDKRGKHLETLDAVTGVTRLTFAYDANGLLASITDQDSRATTIERDSAGTPKAIVAPYGQRTTLTATANQQLEYVEDPIGRKVHVTWDAAGFVRSVDDPKARGWAFDYEGGTGRLTSVSDPAGYKKTLGRTETAKGWQVAVTDPNAQTSVYDVGYDNGKWSRTMIQPDKSDATLIEVGGTMTRKGRDGTKQTVKFGADSAFGAQVRLPYWDEITLPSGKKHVTEYTLAQRNVNDIFNPLDVVAWTDQVTPNGHEYVTRYDRSTRTLTQISPMGRTSVTTFDSLGHPVRFEQAGSPVVEWEYDPAVKGRLSSTKMTANGETRTNTYRYDSGGWIEYFVDAAQQESKYGRDAVGRVKSTTGPDKSATGWDLDYADNVTFLTPPNSQKHEFKYHATLKLLSEIEPPAVADAGAGKVTFDYDAPKHLLTAIHRSDTRSIAFGYNAFGELDTQTLQKATLKFTHTLGRVTQVTRSDGVTLNDTYDGPLWTGTTWSGQVTGSVSASYDSDLRFNTLTVNGQSSVTFGYDEDGLLTSATAATGSVGLPRETKTGELTNITVGKTTTDLTLTDFNEVKHLGVAHSGASLFAQDVIERDPLGRIRHLTETVQGTSHDVRYDYDASGRLKQETRDGLTTSYGYDANGNRTIVTVGTAAPVTSTYDAQDRIQKYGAVQYRHNLHGDLETRTGGTKDLALTYDELGNLQKVEVKDAASQSTVDYIVDGYGRRVARQVGGKFDRAWLYRDSLRPIAEIDSAGNFTHFVYASHNPYSGAPVAMIRGGVFYRIITDHLGSVRLVVNAETGAVAQSIDYDAWGRVIAETGAGFQPFGFAGGLYDAVTGLVRFGARDYDAETGRWTNKDPIGFAGQQGNVYLYVDGDPVNGVDPGGLDVCAVTSAVDYHHEWIEIGEETKRTYGFWPTGFVFGGLGIVFSPDIKAEKKLPIERRRCIVTTPAEDAALEAWIVQVFRPGKLLSDRRYFLGVSDCRHFVADVLAQLSAIQKTKWSILSQVAERIGVAW